MNERLRVAREKAGYASAAEAARRMGVAYGTYSGHENGSRGIKREDIKRYARTFGVSPTWIEHGSDHKLFGREDVPFVGSLGKLPSGQVSWYGDDDAEKLMLLPAITKVPVSALFIHEDFFTTFISLNRALFYASHFEVDVEKFVGELCLCILEDQSTFIRTPYKGQESGRYNLRMAPFEPIDNVKVERVSPIMFSMSTFGYNTARNENIDLAHRLIASRPGSRTDGDDRNR